MGIGKGPVFMEKVSQNQKPKKEGGAVGEWSMALQLRENINKNQKIQGSPPGQKKESDKISENVRIGSHLVDHLTTTTLWSSEA